MARYVFGDLNYLAHYGILGMKWGVRRYQNKDGSYTAAGKARYSFGAKVVAANAAAARDLQSRYTAARLNRASRSVEKTTKKLNKLAGAQKKIKSEVEDPNVSTAKKARLAGRQVKLAEHQEKVAQKLSEFETLRVSRLEKHQEVEAKLQKIIDDANAGGMKMTREGVRKGVDIGLATIEAVASIAFTSAVLPKATAAISGKLGSVLFKGDIAKVAQGAAQVAANKKDVAALSAVMEKGYGKSFSRLVQENVRRALLSSEAKNLTEPLRILRRKQRTLSRIVKTTAGATAGTAIAGRTLTTVGRAERKRAT